MKKRDWHARAALSISIGSAALGCAPTSPQVDRQALDAECDAAYEVLFDERQGAVAAWSARLKTAQGAAELDALRDEGAAINPRFLPRLRELADKGCGQAALDVIDIFGHMAPPPEDEAGYSFGLLEQVVQVHVNAPWIENLGDNDIVWFFLHTSERSRAIQLLRDFVTRTANEDAQRQVLHELASGLIRVPGDLEESEAALGMLDSVVERWPESSEARSAQGILYNQRNLAVGAVMPSIEGLDIDGAPVRLKDFAGRVVVVDFFGFWCPPCRAGLPALGALLERYPRERFAVLGVDAYDDEATFRKGCEQYDVKWPCVIDGKEGTISKSLGISAFPAVFVLDTNGVIRARNPTEEVLASVVAELIAD